MGKGRSEREEARERGITREESGQIEDNWISIVFFFSPPVVSIFLFLGLVLFFFAYSFSLLTSSLFFLFSLSSLITMNTAVTYSFLLWHSINFIYFLKNIKMYPHIGFFYKMAYRRIHRIPIHVPVSVLERHAVWEMLESNKRSPHPFCFT
jgi:hypothetical protein